LWFQSAKPNIFNTFLRLFVLMQGYSRIGIYNKNLKAKNPEKQAQASTDYVNLILFVLLIVVLVLFVVT